MNTTALKEEIQHDYSNLLRILEDTRSSIDTLKPVNDDIKKYVTIFKNILLKSILKIRTRINDIQNNMIWDHLVIAFFGATNAGKSTIIETLRLKYQSNKTDTDGEIVGTGQPDFTEKLDEYNLLILNKRITIIDMPGILSSEEQYKRNIKAALNKAHVVFCVDREGKKPEDKTDQKIKFYLQDCVKVYTIYNVPGFFCENKDSLLTKNVLESTALIEKGYRDVLGDCYAGNIILHAFFALSSIANFPNTRPDLARKQVSAHKKFASDEEIYRFSNFDSLVKLIMNNVPEIFSINKQYLIAITAKTQRFLKKGINRQLNTQREILDELSNLKKM